LILISANIHRAADDTRIAVEIGGCQNKGIIAGVDARRRGLEVVVAAGQIYECRFVGDGRTSRNVSLRGYAAIANIIERDVDV
jgi:hypothetical protein